MFIATVSMCSSISVHCIYTYARFYILVRVVDTELLKKQALVEEAVVHLGQEFEDDAFLRPQKYYCVVFIRPCLIVHHNARQTIPEKGAAGKKKPISQLISLLACKQRKIFAH